MASSHSPRGRSWRFHTVPVEVSYPCGTWVNNCLSVWRQAVFGQTFQHVHSLAGMLHESASKLWFLQKKWKDLQCPGSYFSHQTSSSQFETSSFTLGRQGHAQWICACGVWNQQGLQRLYDLIRQRKEKLNWVWLVNDLQSGQGNLQLVSRPWKVWYICRDTKPHHCLTRQLRYWHNSGKAVIHAGACYAYLNTWLQRHLIGSQGSQDCQNLPTLVVDTEQLTISSREQGLTGLWYVVQASQSTAYNPVDGSLPGGGCGGTEKAVNQLNQLIGHTVGHIAADEGAGRVKLGQVGVAITGHLFHRHSLLLRQLIQPLWCPNGDDEPLLGQLDRPA